MKEKIFSERCITLETTPPKTPKLDAMLEKLQKTGNCNNEYERQK